MFGFCKNCSTIYQVVWTFFSFFKYKVFISLACKYLRYRTCFRKTSPKQSLILDHNSWPITSINPRFAFYILELSENIYDKYMLCRCAYLFSTFFCKFRICVN
jgi:hypothetical protein